VVLAAGQFLFLLIAVQQPAYGYVDPGSGILIVQFISSILGGGIFFLRKRLKQFFHPLKAADASERKSGIES
jgi:hypothetical protein